MPFIQNEYCTFISIYTINHLTTTRLIPTKKTSSKIIYILLFIACISLGKKLGAQNTVSVADSLLNKIALSTGSTKITLQLDLAEEHFEKDNALAEKVALEAFEKAQNSNNELQQIRALFILGKISHVFNSLKSSKAYFDSAMLLATKLNNKWYQAEILLRIGINQHSRSEHILALESFTKAIKAGREGNNYRIVGASYSMMGSIFRINALYDRAIEYIIKAKSNYKKAQFDEGEAWSAYLLGRIYHDIQLHDKALNYFNEALDIYTKMLALDRNKTGVAICKEQLGLLHLDDNNLSEARKNIMYTLKTYSETKSRSGISSAYKNLGYIEYASGNYTLAYEYLNQAFQDKTNIGERLSIPGIYHYLGLCEIKMGQMQKGISTIKKGLELASSNHQKHIELNIYKSLFDIHLNNNSLNKAIYYQQKQIEVQDSMLLGSASIKYEQLQGIYEIDEKNNQIEELKKRNEINALRLKQNRTTRVFMGIAIGVALLIALIVFIFYRRIQQKNQLLAEANAAKDRFFAIIAHDLRGPSSTLTSFLEHIHREFDDFSQDEIKDMLHTSFQSSQKVSTLLDTLLSWANSQSNKININPEKLNLTHELNKAMESLKHSADKKQIHINCVCDNSLFVKADANMFQTILRNLLSNSIKFTPREGSVRLSTKADNDKQVLIRISDNGIGIKPNILNQLFELSNKHHTLGTENEYSTGLGLVLVKEFVEKNQGLVSMNSKVGKGTTVSIKLPMA